MYLLCVTHSLDDNYDIEPLAVSYDEAKLEKRMQELAKIASEAWEKYEKENKNFYETRERMIKEVRAFLRENTNAIPAKWLGKSIEKEKFISEDKWWWDKERLEEVLDMDKVKAVPPKFEWPKSPQEPFSYKAEDFYITEIEEL